jgi:methionine aminopeptidase
VDWEESGEWADLFCRILGDRDLGCHIDGFVAVVAHTHMLCDGPVKGRAADVLMACHTAAEVALRLVRPGRKV